jgi:hypothetical protein
MASANWMSVGFGHFEKCICRNKNRTHVSKVQTPQTGGVVVENCGPRRLPLYFMLDFSGSASAGLAAGAVRQVREVITRLRALAEQNREEYNRAPVFYTVIVFRSTALQFQPLASLWAYSLDDLRLEEIKTQGTSGLGTALAALKKSIEHELKMPGADNGDCTPLVFLFSDGLPAGEWEDHLEILSGIKLFVCGTEPPPPSSAPSQRGGQFISGFLPLNCHMLIGEQIEKVRAQLRTWQQMIDYSTKY